MLNFLLLIILGERLDTAFRAALILSPVGEFSFVIAGAGLSVGALSAGGHKLAIAVIAMSLLVSPLFFLAARMAQNLPWWRRGLIAEGPPAPAPALPDPGE